MEKISDVVNRWMFQAIHDDIDISTEELLSLSELDLDFFHKVHQVHYFQVRIRQALNKMEPEHSKTYFELCGKAYSSFHEMEHNEQHVKTLVECIKQEIEKSEEPQYYASLLDLTDYILSECLSFEKTTA